MYNIYEGATMAVTESTQDMITVNLTSVDWVKSVPELGVVFCTAPGDVNVELLSGRQVKKYMLAGEYWRVSPIKILKSGTTATVEFHI